MKRNSHSECSKSILAKLLKDPLSLISICVIGLFALFALFSYFLSPDSTPFANEQHLEIAVKKPGFKVDMLQIENKTVRNLISKLVSYSPEYRSKIFCIIGKYLTMYTEKL